MSPTNAFSKEQTIAPQGAARHLALTLVAGLAIAGLGSLAASFISLSAISGTVVGVVTTSDLVAALASDGRVMAQADRPAG